MHLAKSSNKVIYKVVPNEEATKESIEKLFEEYHSMQRQVIDGLNRKWPKRVIYFWGTISILMQIERDQPKNTGLALLRELRK